MTVKLPFIGFRIKSGPGPDRHYSPVFEALLHLMEPSFQSDIKFVKMRPGPYIVEITTDDRFTWMEIGQLYENNFFEGSTNAQPH